MFQVWAYLSACMESSLCMALVWKIAKQWIAWILWFVQSTVSKTKLSILLLISFNLCGTYSTMSTMSTMLIIKLFLCVHFSCKVWYFIAFITTGFINFIHGLIWIFLFVFQLVVKPSSTCPPDFSHLIPVIWEYHLGDLCVDPVIVRTTVTTIALI